jgi:hypothetical protein
MANSVEASLFSMFQKTKKKELVRCRSENRDNLSGLRASFRSLSLRKLCPKPHRLPDYSPSPSHRCQHHTSGRQCRPGDERFSSCKGLLSFDFPVKTRSHPVNSADESAAAPTDHSHLQFTLHKSPSFLVADRPGDGVKLLTLGEATSNQCCWDGNGQRHR